MPDHPTAPVSPFRSTRTTPEDRARKREALLRAAVHMFNERGFHATSLDDVAASLGVTKPVIYKHLGNKDQVLFECVALGVAELLESARQAAAVPGTGLDRLQFFLRRYSEVVMEDFGRCMARTGDEVLSPAARSRFREMKREIDTAMRHLIAQAAADGSATVKDVRITAFAVAGALNWPARWFDPHGAIGASEMAAALVDTLVQGIRSKDHPPSTKASHAADCHADNG